MVNSLTKQDFNDWWIGLSLTKVNLCQNSSFCLSMWKLINSYIFFPSWLPDNLSRSSMLNKAKRQMGLSRPELCQCRQEPQTMPSALNCAPSCGHSMLWSRDLSMTTAPSAGGIGVGSLSLKSVFTIWCLIIDWSREVTWCLGRPIYPRISYLLVSGSAQYGTWCSERRACWWVSASVYSLILLSQ